MNLQLKNRNCAALAAVLLSLALLAAGCSSNKYVVHPGSVSSFDSQAYDSLLVAEAAIDAAKAQYAAGQIPAASKDLLNKAIGIYDIAQASWHTYHDTAASASSADVSKLQAQLTDDLNQLSQAISVFEQSVGKKAPAAKLGKL